MSDTSAVKLSALQKAQELVNARSDDGRKQDHMVYQVWNDGEVTLQKGGDLLWKRTLHSDAPGLHKGIKLDINWPHKTTVGYSYIFTDREGAYAVREAIRAALVEHISSTF
jgi:hypothetical protein